MSKFLSSSQKLVYMSRQGFKTAILPEPEKAFINGKWLNSITKKKFEVLDPFSKDRLGDVADCDVNDAQIAVQAAKEAFQNWGYETTARERAAILNRWYQILIEKQDALAELMTKEQGKPLAEAKTEIAYSASFLDWYSGEARRIYGQVVPAPVLNRQHLHTREPIGVVGVITPWNFPSAMIARKAAAAIAAGCTLVVKPAHETPYSALALAQTAKEAGLPNGVFNVIPASHENTLEISKFLCASPDVACISFTGSTAVGRLLLHQSADTIKRVCLELGGNAPFIVFESADIDEAIHGLLVSKFRCSGQTCVSANRVFVQDSIHDAFVEKLKGAVSKFVCGDGLDPKTTIGPLISDKAVAKVKGLFDDAVSKKATVVHGGKVFEGTNLFEPTIITGVTEDMELANTEIFGPIVAIQKFKTEEEALKRANNIRFGLAGYVFTNDYKQINRVTRRLETGMIGVNEGAISAAEAAFGGIKESGLGREGGSQGIDEFTQWKYLCIKS